MRLGLILSCLLLLLASCGKPDEKEFTYKLLSPGSAEIFQNGDIISIEVEVSDNVASAEFLFDNVSIGTSNNGAVELDWTSSVAGGGVHALIIKIYPVDYEPVTLNVPLLFEYSEGEQNQGGMIFFLDETGIHGMAVATKDMVHGNKSEFIWGPETFIGATDSTDGISNTYVLSNSSIMASYVWPAFKLGYIYAGYNDWYVPSRKEMMMLLDFVSSGGTDLPMDDTYWTSTECCRANACAVDFNKRKAFTCLKADSLFRIRPVRKF